MFLAGLLRSLSVKTWSGHLAPLREILSLYRSLYLFNGSVEKGDVLAIFAKPFRAFADVAGLKHAVLETLGRGEKVFFTS